MNNGKHVIPSSKRKGKKSLLLVVALALVLTMAISGTVAYLIANTEPVVNVFQPTEVQCEIQDYKVTNTGDINAYIRAAVVANYVTENGHICREHAAPTLPHIGEGWNYNSDDGFYYYNYVVASGNSTTPVVKSYASNSAASDGCKVKYEVFASAIQAEPSDVVGTVWGYTPGN